MQKIMRNGELCHGEQKANSHNSGRNGLKTIVVVWIIELTPRLRFGKKQCSYCATIKYHIACSVRIFIAPQHAFDQHFSLHDQHIDKVIQVIHIIDIFIYSRNTFPTCK